MRLNDWLVQTGMTQAVLARELRTSADTVRRWINGGSLPSRRLMLRLAQVTAGNVLAEDFTEVHGTRELSLQDVVKKQPPQ